MRFLSVSILVVALASFATAEDQPNKGTEKAPVKTETTAVRDQASITNQDVVVLQGQQRLVIPIKSITAVSYTAVNTLSISVSPSPVTEGPNAPQMVKTKDHYVGIVWTDKSETSGMVLKMGIEEFSGFMTAMESAGIKPTNADELRITK